MNRWLIALTVTVCLTGAAAQAADFPTRPITVVVPFAPGGGLDVTTRIVAPDVTKRLGHQVVVENRGGAGGAIGAELVSRAAPDGYTLLVYASTATIDPSLRPKLKYDFRRDFVPVTMLVQTPYVLLVNPQLPMTTVADVIAYARKNPGKVFFGSPGIGTIGHLTAELFKAAAKVELTHIPYKGSGPAILAVVTNETQVSFETPLQTYDMVRAGKLRAVGISSKERWPTLPEVPAISETVPGFESVAWIGLFAPAGTPKETVQQLYRAFAGAVNSGETQEKIIRGGMRSVGNTPDEFASRIATEIPIWAKVISDARIKLED